MMPIRKLLLAAAALALLLSPALADYVARDGNNNLITFEGVVLPGGVNLQNTNPVDADGAAYTNANPFPVTCVSGCGGGGGGGDVNITGLNGAAPSAANPLFVAPGTGYTFPVSIGGALPLPTGAATSANQVAGNGNVGAPGSSPCSLDTGNCNLNALLQRNNQRLTSIIAALGSPMQTSGGTVGIAGTLPAFASPPTVNQGTSPWIVSCSGCAAGSRDEAAFSPGTSVVGISGGFFQTTATSNPLASGQGGAFQVTAQRALFTNLRSSSGAEVGVASAPLRVDPTGSTAQPVTGTFWQATQPVSAASLPLPAGAATSAKQPAIGTAGVPSADVLTVQGAIGMTPLSVSFASTPTVSVTQGTSPWVVSNGGTFAVQAAQSGSWTVTANAGTNLNTSLLALESGGNLAAVATGVGAPGSTACATDTGACNLNALAQRIAQRLTTVNGTLGSPFQAGGSIGNTAFGATQSGSWTVGVSGSVAVTGTFWPYALGQTTMSASVPVAIASDQGDVPISAASLPLPTGAATAANQTGGSQKTQIVDGSGNVVGSASNSLNVNCTAGCSGGGGGTSSNFGAAFPTAGTAAGFSDGTNMVPGRINGSNELLVHDATVAADLGTINTTLGSPFQAGGSIGNTAFGISGALPAGSNTIGAVTQASGPWTQNVTQFGGSNVATGTGASGAGVPRVTVSNDSTVGLNAGSNVVGKVGIDQTTNGTTNAVSQPDARPASGNITAADSGSSTAGGPNGQFIVTGTPTAGSTVANATVGAASVVFQLTGTWSGNVSFEQSVDGGTTWTQLACVIAQASGNPVGIANVATGIGIYQCAGNGSTSVRARATSGFTGTAVVQTVLTSLPSVAKTLNVDPSATTFKLIAANSNNSTSIKTTPGSVFGVQVYNNSATIAYLKLYDKATAPTCGTDTPKKVVMIPANTSGAGSNVDMPKGAYFGSGIGICVVTGIADSDNTSVAANAYVVNLDYR